MTDDNPGLYAAALSNRGDRVPDIAEGTQSLVVHGAADVEGEAHQAGYGVHRSARHIDFADGRHEVGARAGAGFDRDQHFGRRCQRVVAHRHWHSTGVAGDAIDLDDGTRDAVDRRHDADGEPFLFQHRALLDVDLDIADDPIRLARFRRQA